MISAMTFVGTMWSLASFAAVMTQRATANGWSLSGCCVKRDALLMYRHDVNHTKLREISDVIGVPVTYAGEHHCHWPLGDAANSSQPTHHSSIYNWHHPKGTIHVSYMGNDTEGENIWRIGLGEHQPAGNSTHSHHRPRNVDVNTYFNQQTFINGARLMMKERVNPDGIPTDYMKKYYDPVAEWDDFYWQMKCYMDKYGSKDPPGFWSQVFDQYWESTAWAGVFASIGAYHSSGIEKYGPGAGLIPDIPCVNYCYGQVCSSWARLRSSNHTAL